MLFQIFISKTLYVMLTCLNGASLHSEHLLGMLSMLFIIFLVWIKLLMFSCFKSKCYDSLNYIRDFLLKHVHIYKFQTSLYTKIDYFTLSNSIYLQNILEYWHLTLTVFWETSLYLVQNLCQVSGEDSSLLMKLSFDCKVEWPVNMNLGPLSATEMVTNCRNRPTGTLGNSALIQTTWETALGKNPWGQWNGVSNVSWQQKRWQHTEVC